MLAQLIKTLVVDKKIPMIESHQCTRKLPYSIPSKQSLKVLTICSAILVNIEARVEIRSKLIIVGLHLKENF